MPRINKTTIKHINLTVAAGTGQTASPDTPRRNYLLIKNGAGAATLKFGYPASGAVSDEYPMAANEILEFDTVVPITSVNVFSTAGTTFSILEGVDNV